MAFSAGNPANQGMPGGKDAKLEERLRKAAAEFRFPATPDLTGREFQRVTRQARAERPRGRFTSEAQPRRLNRLAAALAVLVVVLAAVMLVSPVRARVLEWIRLGAVRIFLIAPTPTVTLPAGGAAISPEPGTPASSTAGPQGVTPSVIPSVLDLAGEMSLAEAQKQAGFAIQLPTVPPLQEQPDYVFLQEISAPVLVLVWMDPERPDQVLMVLSETPSENSVFEKYEPSTVLDTQVNGQPALWVGGNYLLLTRNGEFTFTRLVSQGHTLIWTRGDLTFRLETDADLDQAIRIAESIQ